MDSHVGFWAIPGGCAHLKGDQNSCDIPCFIPWAYEIYFTCHITGLVHLIILYKLKTQGQLVTSEIE